MSGTEKTDGSLALTPRIITIPAKEPERTRKLRVAAYTRVNSNSKDQLHSFVVQNAYYSKLITGNPEWELVDVYADKSSSTLFPCPFASVMVYSLATVI